MPKTKDLAGKVAVITGAASGFGREFARLAARRGCKLVLADVQEDALAEAAAELSAHGAELLAQPTNVSKAEQVEALAERTLQRFGAVHLLFNNAGVGAGGLIWENTVQDWEWVLGVNLWGVVHGIRTFTPLMMQGMRADPEYFGHIVNTSSIAGLLSPPGLGVYNVSKHAVVTLSETLYHDLRLIEARIGVSVLCPAFVPTGIAHSHRNRPAELTNQAPPTPSQLRAQAQTKKAVESGHLTAAQVAEQTFSAIDEDRFYILTHPKILSSVATRLQDILEQRPPSDPFAHKPDVKPKL
ncbi:MAG TPA: SDR family oxidoreductase [Pseudomonadota bacterium]|nr:SDR family oxidoreductase [Pseudomonadota bacterium]